MSSRPHDVLVIGAGPYGLSAAAHLRARGANAIVFGAPMSFWKEHMPKGMRLKSSWGASRIADPARSFTLERFERERGATIARPIPIDDFIAYGEWFEHGASGEIDPRRVERVERSSAGFRATLDDGATVESSRVVVAAGISDFAWTPPEFVDLPPDLASHSSRHTDLGRFAGRRVAVIGAGQSGLETAVLLHEAGADVEVIVRAPVVRWVGRATREGVVGRLFFDRTDVGPPFVSHLVAHPRVLRRMPASMIGRATRRSIAPGASHWLLPRAVGIPITTGRWITSATPANGRLRVVLNDGSDRDLDHAVLATGYRVDVRRYRFLAPQLLAEVRIADGFPVLGNGLESSVPGLHFLGAPAMATFGPLVRFVSGTEFAAGALTRKVTGSRALVRGPAAARDDATISAEGELAR